MENNQVKSKKAKIKSGKFFLLVLVIILLSPFVIVLRKNHIPKPSVPVKKEPTKRAKVVLRSSLAGIWYTNDANALYRQFDSFFQKAEVELIDNVIALILPHAGYQWSGQTAAFGLKTTDKKYKRIIVIGPSHRTNMEEILSVPRATHCETPLGEIPLDTEFIDKLLKFPVIQNIPYAHQSENSIEMELPILRYCQKDFKLVPIVAGKCSLQTIRKAGRILKSLIDDQTLIVASSDFVHYGRGHSYVPFTENIPEKIKKLDMGAYEYIEKLDEEGFLKYKHRTGVTICGYIPVAILLSMMDKPVNAELVKYAASGEITGDFSNSVSYLSVVFSGKWGNHPQIKARHSNPRLTQEDKRQLLSLARESIIYFLQKKRPLQESELDFKLSDAMKCPRAAFVTLNKHSRLRGCIGDIFPTRPLYRSVIYNAVNAAVNDRRFNKVTISECNEITIEISALTSPEPVDSWKEIRVGTDGMVLRKNGRSAVFLPQVPPQQGWDINQTLTQLSLKAGLSDNAWRQGANFLVFQAVVFGEEK